MGPNAHHGSISQGKTPAAPGGRLDPLDWLGESGAQGDVLQAMERQLKTRRRRRITGAAGAAAVVLLAALVWQKPWTDTPLATPKRSEGGSAIVHAPARQTLPDGSIVEMKDGAKLNVAFHPASAGPRRVELLSGEAHFQVKKNPARPFVVVVGGIEVRAVGTAFSVNRSPTQVEVLVTEGRVGVERVSYVASGSVDPNALSAALDEKRLVDKPLHLLSAGERTVLNLADDATPQVETLPVEQIQEALSWRVPRLEFSGTPLDEAVPMINEYSRVKLVLGDESLGAVRISGILRADNIEALRELLAETKGKKSEYRSDDKVVLTKAR